MDRILLDTDVILDFFFDREPFSKYAAELLNLCAVKQVKVFITPVIICNVYYLLRKSASHAVVIDKLKQFLSIVDILKMDKQIVLHALDSDFKDFEDALQNYSAVRNGRISVIITRNTKHYKKSELAVMTAETYLKMK